MIIELTILTLLPITQWCPITLRATDEPAPMRLVELHIESTEIFAVGSTPSRTPFASCETSPSS
jgi:hypothetical protein